MIVFTKVQSACADCAALALITMSLFGCGVAAKMAPPTASVETVENLRAAKLAPATTGTFEIAPGKNEALAAKYSQRMRGSTITPESGSFSQHLKEQIVADLKAAGLYDPKSGIVIEAQLTDIMVDAGNPAPGVARLAARFTVTRAGKREYDKELAVDDEWKSSSLGAIAIPAAMNHYAALYKALAAKLFEDPEFHGALEHR